MNTPITPELLIERKFNNDNNKYQFLKDLWDWDCVVNVSDGYGSMVFLDNCDKSTEHIKYGVGINTNIQFIEELDTFLSFIK